MVTMEDIKKMVELYQDELRYMHPFVNSNKFADNSYRKWACGEILKEIEKTKDLPFDITPLQLLNQFADKMKRYAYMNSKNSLAFTIASETAEYLIDEYWILDRKKNERKVHII